MNLAAHASRIAVALVLGAATMASAQTAVDQLEQQIRGAEPPAATAPGREPGYLGIVVDDRLDVGRGIRVVEVTAGGPADRAGLRLNDLITAIDEEAMRTMDDFIRVMLRSPAGTQRSFVVQREGQQHTIVLMLGQRPAGTPAGSQPNGDAQGGLLGVRVSNVTPEIQRLLSLPEARGALVVSVTVNSPADKAGIEPESVIVALNGERIDDPNALADRIAAAGEGQKVTIAFFQDGLLVERAVILGAAAGPPSGVAPPASVPPTVAPPPAVVNGNARIEALERRLREVEQRLAEVERLLKAALPPGQRT